MDVSNAEGNSGGASDASLPRRVTVAYSVGQLGWAILINIVGFWLVFLYRGEFQTEASTALVAGLALSIIAGGGRLFDAVTDPVIATLSDRSTFDSISVIQGRRLPFMAAGALPAGLFCVLLFSPPSLVQSTTNIIWLAAMSVLFYLFLTLYGTPYFALLPELSRTTGDRVTLATGIAIGWALGLAVAAQASVFWGLVEASTALGRADAIRVTMVGLSAVAVVCMYIPVVVISERTHAEPAPSSKGLGATLKAFSQNRDFLSYVVADFSYFAGLMLINSALPFYATALLEIPEAIVGALLGVVILTWFLVYPFVQRLATRFGKKRLIRTSFLSLGIVFCAISGLGLVPINPYVQAFGVSILSAIPMAFLSVLPNAVLGDIATLDAEETGEKQEGMFFAGRTFVQKLGQSTGLFVLAALAILGDQPGDALGIRLTGIVGATLCFGAFLAFGYYREARITSRLDEYEQPAD